MSMAMRAYNTSLEVEGRRSVTTPPGRRTTKGSGQAAWTSDLPGGAEETDADGVSTRDGNNR